MSGTQEAIGAIPGEARCWCCNGSFPDNRLVHLGAHPEVGVCRRCVRYLGRRSAQLPGRATPLAYLRRSSQELREWVMVRGLHEGRFLGPVVRRIGRFLP